MRRSKAKLSEGSRAVEDERTSEAKWPQGAANATWRSVRMSRRTARQAGLCASESPLTWRTDECRHEGMDPENTTPSITMRSENLA